MRTILEDIKLLLLERQEIRPIETVEILKSLRLILQSPDPVFKENNQATQTLEDRQSPYLMQMIRILNTMLGNRSELWAKSQNFKNSDTILLLLRLCRLNIYVQLSRKSPGSRFHRMMRMIYIPQ